MIPLDTVMLVGLHSIWKSRMALRHADVNVGPVRKYFAQTVCELTAVYKTRIPPPEWLSVFEELKALYDF